LPFPDDLLNQLGWDIGDTLEWEVLKSGGFTLKKVENEQT
jgi:hypothetical protein